MFDLEYADRVVLLNDESSELDFFLIIRMTEYFCLEYFLYLQSVKYGIGLERNRTLFLQGKIWVW